MVLSIGSSSSVLKLSAVFATASPIVSMYSSESNLVSYAKVLTSVPSFTHTNLSSIFLSTPFPAVPPYPCSNTNGEKWKILTDGESPAP
jgi:hypothetical protein